MPASRQPKMVASYKSLPAELLSRIAELVHEQDLAFQHLGIRREAGANADDSGDSGFDIEENVCGGVWSSSYARGIKAMVRVDRSTRAAALPHLYKDVTSKQTHAPWFRVEVLGEDLGRYVHHLEVFEGGALLEQRAASLASALRKLPNLSSLNLGYYLLIKLVEPQPGVELSECDLMLRRALRTALGKVTSLTLQSSFSKVVLEALVRVSGSKLRRLNLPHPPSRASLGDEFKDVLHGLVGLVELELGGTRDIVTAMCRNLRLPSVRSLILGIAQPYEDDLELAHFLAPSISCLTIRDSTSTVAPRPPGSALPSPLLPTLHTLVVDANSSRLAFHQVPLPALEHFVLSIEQDCESFPFDDGAVPFKSAALRTITLAFRSYPDNGLPHFGHEAFEDLCADYDIHLDVKYVPVSTSWLTRSVVEDPSADKEVLLADDTKRETLLDTLDWARRRAEWLHKVDDGPGLHELAEATAPLHERYIIDRS